MTTLSEPESKTIWHSKTFWANVIFLLGLVVQHYTGQQLDSDAQVELLAGINIGLRIATKTGIA